MMQAGGRDAWGRWEVPRARRSREEAEKRGNGGEGISNFELRISNWKGGMGIGSTEHRGNGESENRRNGGDNFEGRIAKFEMGIAVTHERYGQRSSGEAERRRIRETEKRGNGEPGKGRRRRFRIADCEFRTGGTDEGPTHERRASGGTGPTISKFEFRSSKWAETVLPASISATRKS
jgi:hypothetical protein